MSFLQEHTVSLQKNKAVKPVWLFLSAFLLLMLASRSSFLYPCNDWCDANSYFSVGKALFNGKMPYRDVFDQKGMYLYFFYGLAYLLSHTTFWGVFLLEVIAGFFDLLGIAKILELYVEEKAALFLAPLVLAVTVTSDSFYWGGSAEELCLPFLIWGLYFVLHYFEKDYLRKKMSFRILLLNGFFAGMVANIKFTSLGFFFAWMMCVAFSFVRERDWWGAVKASLVFLLGMFLPFLPWLVYFGWNHGLYEWYYGYVYVNVFLYSNLNGEGPSLWERCYTLSKLLYWVIRENMIYFGFVIIGVLWLFFGRGKKLLERFAIAALCFFLFLGIYVGGSSLPYYALPLSVFTVLGFAGLFSIGERLYCKSGKNRKQSRVKEAAVMVITLAAGLVLVFCTSVNIPHMKEKKEDIFLFQFKKIVEETENPTLLNISCLDAGLYTVCDIVPTCRWFQTQTIQIIDEVLKEQEQYIREGRTSYVLARNEYPKVIWEQYELVAQAPWYQDGVEFTYYLFKRKE